MKPSDKIIIKKIIDYCLQIKETHEYFNNDKNLFLNDEKGFIYRNSITMPILQIGELAKVLSEEYDYAYARYCCPSLWQFRLWNCLDYIGYGY